jgi:5'-nucleotidase
MFNHIGFAQGMTGLMAAMRVSCIALLLASCGFGGPPPPSTTSATSDGDTLTVKLIAFNDLHGNLEPPQLSIDAPALSLFGGTVAVPAGGAAYLATAIASLRAENPNHAVISAGDMIGATPLVSALFLDEPTIEVGNALGLDFNVVGNHEFDRGQPELLRKKNGGCAKSPDVVLEPCQVNKNFPGAHFPFLAANTLQQDGSTLFPAAGMKSFTQGDTTVKVGFIGMTLKGTPKVVAPAGVAGLRFLDEADTANVLVPQLKARGADAIVVVVHEGGTTPVDNDKNCTGLTGDIRSILDRLDTAVDVVISGHTHRAYVCDYARYNPAKPFLLTSAGKYGTLLTNIDLTFDTRTRKVTAKTAANVIVQGEAFTKGATTIALTDRYPRFDKDPKVAALIATYAAAAGSKAQRIVGKVSPGAVSRKLTAAGESTLGDMIADAQLAATRETAKGGARIAFMHPGGLRADLAPAADGSVSYEQIFNVQPFGNSLVVKTMTGAQIKAVLEQQFATGRERAEPWVLFPSAGFTYSYNLTLAPGARVSGLLLDGAPLGEAKAYRVAMSSFLAEGGDGFTVFQQGTDDLGGDLELDALEAYLQAHDPLAAPVGNRIVNLTPP